MVVLTCLVVRRCWVEGAPPLATPSLLEPEQHLGRRGVAPWPLGLSPHPWTPQVYAGRGLPCLQHSSPSELLSSPSKLLFVPSRLSSYSSLKLRPQLRQLSAAVASPPVLRDRISGILRRRPWGPANL